MEEKKIIIAIDGHSSCGKSTFAKAIAAKMGYVFIDSGALYRAVTLYAMRNELIDSIYFEPLISELSKIDIKFQFNELLCKSETYLNGENVESEIRTMEVSSKVSQISSIAAVREFVSSLLQSMGRQKGIVMDGRDIGTTVFPDAELKIYMTASVEVRAERRYRELLSKGEATSLELVAENIRNRDYIDENRAESPLRKADDAITLDNSYMNVSEQMVWVEKLIKERL
ncbi:MAG: (d)CMP kinase [Rikenellaceae bacterium]